MTVLPAGWTEFSIADLGGTVGGKTPSKSVPHYWSPADIPWVSPKDMKRPVLHGAEDSISERATTEAGMTVLSPGTVLMVTRSGILAHTFPVALTATKVTINQDIKAVRPTREVVSRYLAYALKAYGPHILEGCSKAGTTVASVETELLESFKLPLAPLPEQQRIADKLDALLARVDACRDRLDRVPAILKRFRQAVLSTALDGALSAEWRAAQSRDQSDWRQTTIDEVADVGTGSTPLRSNPAFFDQAGTPWVTSAATGSDYIDAAAESVTPAAIAAHRLKIYPPRTLLVAMYGEGKTRGQVSELRIHATINQACAAVRVDESKALTSYIKLALRAQYEQMRALAEGGNQPNLNLSKVKGIELRLPPKTEQVEIVRRVESLFALADAIEAKWQAAHAQVERLTPALLAKAYRGELVPQDPSDEPASALLARLRGGPGAAAAPPRKRGHRRVTPESAA